MKLIVAIIQDKDVSRLMDALVKEGFGATKLATTGGFLREGNTTLLIGTSEERVDDAIDLISQLCRSRQQVVTPVAPVGGPVDSYIPYPVEVKVGGATIFVLDVDRHVHV